MTLQTELPIKTLPAGIRAALTHFQITRGTVRIEGRDVTRVSSYAHGHKIAAVAVCDDVHYGPRHVFRGCFGGNNGYNKPTGLDWDPDFSEVSHDVPAAGAILSGHIDGYVVVAVTPATFAKLVNPTSADTLIAGDAATDGRNEDATTLAARALEASLPSLTTDEQAVIYAYCGLKSGNYRNEITVKCGAARDALVARGFLKVARNGATQATDAAKAYYASKRNECQNAGLHATSPWLNRSEAQS